MTRGLLTATIAALLVTTGCQPEKAGAAEKDPKTPATAGADKGKTEVKPTEVKPTEVKPEAAMPADAKPEEAKPADAKPEEAKPVDGKAADAK
jgi:hypothetical protein